MANNLIYLDNAATTIPDAESLAKAADNMLNDGFYNPSALYSGGMSVKKHIENIRKELIAFMGGAYDIVFTASGSEADNLAIFSCGKRGNIVTDQGEHSAVFNSFKELKNRNVEVRFAPLNKNGSVNQEKLLSLIDDNTTFLSISHVNNETGAVNPVNEIAKQVKKKNSNVIVHCDGVQAFLKIPFKPAAEIDLYAVSAHKICALKGVGALFYKKNLTLHPIIFGGGQEKGLRSGTENTFGINVFYNSFLKYKDVEKLYGYVYHIKELFIKNLSDDTVLISDEQCSPYIISFSIPGVKAEIMQRVLDDKGIVVGTGSACSSKVGVSRIISSCGYDKKTAEGVLRVSFIYTTKEEDVVYAAKTICECAKLLKRALK